MDYYSFKNGTSSLFLTPDELAKKVFNQIDDNLSGFLNWPEFIRGVRAFKSKSLQEKIRMFVKLIGKPLPHSLRSN